MFSEWLEVMLTKVIRIGVSYTFKGFALIPAVLFRKIHVTRTRNWIT